MQKETIDLETQNHRLKTILRSFLKHAFPEEGQAWGFDFIMSEDLYGEIEDLCK